MNILFTCVVIQKTERRMIRRARELHAKGLPLIMSGCLVTTFPDKALDAAPGALLVPPRELKDHNGRTIEGWLGERRLKHLPSSITDTLRSERGNTLPKTLQCDEVPGPEGRSTFIVPISQGCLGSCSYCITKQARGRLMSYPPPDIVDMVKEAVRIGKKEIQLTSQDTGIYGRDIGSSLPELLHRLVKVHGDFRIRVGMMNPAGLALILDGLIEAYSSLKIFKFLHMPIQSGDDTILWSMKRGYSVVEAEEIVQRFRSLIPDLTFSTDIITGFPGEDDVSFEKTLKLVERLAPDLVNITRFSERPGTGAVTLKNKVHGRVSKERSRKLTQLRFRISAEKNRTFVGREMRVLVTERGKGGSVICRDDNYRLVVIKQALPVGEWVDVKIIDSTEVYLLGRTM